MKWKMSPRERLDQIIDDNSDSFWLGVVVGFLSACVLGSIIGLILIQGGHI